MRWRAGLAALWLIGGCGAVEPLGADAQQSGVDAGHPDVGAPGSDASGGDASGPAGDTADTAQDSAVGPSDATLDAFDTQTTPDAAGPDATAPVDVAVTPDGTVDAGPDTVEPPAPLTIDGFADLVGAQDGPGLDAFVALWDMPICDGARCLFVTVQPGAGSVLVLGDFNGWEGGAALASVPARPEVWWGIVEMGQPPLVEYKLQVDGEWTVDSSNVYFHFGPFGSNSAIYGPGASRLRLIPGVWSSELANERDLYVYLPAAYFQDVQGSFPVIYLQDGFNVFTNPAAPFGSWNVEVTADALMASGQAAPAILVGIDTHDRLDEYLHAPITVLDDIVSGAKLDLYSAFLVGTVKPLVDATLRTQPDPAHTGIAGSSLGGLSSLYLAVTQPGIFGLCGTFSGSFWVGEEGGGDAWAPSLREVIDQEDPPPEGFRVYIDSGDSDFEGSVSYESDSWVYSDWTRNELIARGWDNRAEWDTDADVSTPPLDLPANTTAASVPSLAWAATLPASYGTWGAWLGTDRSLLSMVGHGQAHNEAAWEKRFGAALTFLLPGPAAQ